MKQISNFKLQTSKSGFTLIEVIIVIVIVGILAGIGVPLTINLIESFQYSIYKKDLSGSAEVVLQRMAREIRRLKDNESVLEAANTTYRFVDIDNVTIQFQLTGSRLEREYGGQSDVLAAQVQDFEFIYLDDQNGVLASPLVSPDYTDIKFVMVNMTLSSNDNSIEYTALIRPRNLVGASDLFP